jgi:DNA-binding GntR family transcriptional regulator
MTTAAAPASKTTARAPRPAASAKSPRAETLRSDTAYEQIKIDIVGCVLMPGQALTEKQIGERYTLRKATVRSALTRLSQEGLIKSEPRRGYVVAPIAMRDVNEIFELRSLIEPEVYRLAATTMTEGSLADIEHAAQRVLKPETLKSHMAFIAADRVFRLAIAEATGNFRIVRLLGQVLDQSERVMHLGYLYVDLTKVLMKQQKALTQALASDEPAAVAELAHAHCNALKTLVINALLSESRVMDINLHPGK